MRIMLADDHTVLRQALARVLASRPGIQVVGEAANGAEAVRMASELLPDVVLMDISMPELDGLAATARIQAQGLPVKVLILTVHDREEYLFKALQAGALGYVLKETDMDELLTAVRTVERSSLRSASYGVQARCRLLATEQRQRRHRGRLRHTQRQGKRDTEPHCLWLYLRSNCLSVGAQHQHRAYSP